MTSRLSASSWSVMQVCGVDAGFGRGSYRWLSTCSTYRNIEEPVLERGLDCCCAVQINTAHLLITLEELKYQTWPQNSIRAQRGAARALRGRGLHQAPLFTTSSKQLPPSCGTCSWINCFFALTSATACHQSESSVHAASNTAAVTLRAICLHHCSLSASQSNTLGMAVTTQSSSYPHATVTAQAGKRIMRRYTAHV